MTSNRITEAVRSDPLWILLPLRAFLAFTFLYAGLSKVGDRSFFDDDSPTGIHQTVIAVKSQSPIGGLLGPVVDHSFAFGLPMALGEVAVGLGMLLGLFHRLAALGGMVLALSLFLTVSWGADPWYTGADIVYMFAFAPILLAGPTPLSLDDWLRRSRTDHPGASEDRTRRLVLVGSAAVLGLACVGVASLFRGSKTDNDASADESGPPASPTSAAASPTATDPSSSSAATPSPTATGAKIISAAAVPVGGGAEAKDPKSGHELWVLQLESGEYTAYSAVCPHQGCTVNFVSKSAGFLCPCHASKFDSAGRVTHGPATRDLTRLPVAESNGQIVAN